MAYTNGTHSPKEQLSSYWRYQEGLKITWSKLSEWTKGAGLKGNLGCTCIRQAQLKKWFSWIMQVSQAKINPT